MLLPFTAASRQARALDRLEQFQSRATTLLQRLPDTNDYAWASSTELRADLTQAGKDIAGAGAFVQRKYGEVPGPGLGDILGAAMGYGTPDSSTPQQRLGAELIQLGGSFRRFGDDVVANNDTASNVRDYLELGLGAAARGADLLRS